MRLYRDFSYGSLASFFVLDTRQYRSDQPCGDRNNVPMCEGVAHPHTTLLGTSQERWLLDGLDRSSARWNVLPQQIMMAKVDLRAGPEIGVSADQWSAYDAERTRVLEFFGTRRPANPIILTGDIHSNWVNDLKVDFRKDNAPVIATEFVGTSITSGGDGVDVTTNSKTIRGENSFVKFHNGQRGYVSCDVTAKSLRADYQIVDYVTRPGAPRKTRASFIVENGSPGAVAAMSACFTNRRGAPPRRLGPAR